MWKDEIVEALHQSREAHARRFHFDVQAICADLQAQEKNSRRRFVSRSPRPAKSVTRKADKAHLFAPPKGRRDNTA